MYIMYCFECIKYLKNCSSSNSSEHSQNSKLTDTQFKKMGQKGQSNPFGIKTISSKICYSENFQIFPLSGKGPRNIAVKLVGKTCFFITKFRKHLF